MKRTYSEGHSNNHLTIFESLQFAQKTLKSAWADQYFQAPPNANLDAQVLLAHAMNVTKTHLFTNPESSLTADQQSAFEAAVARRTRREPVAYIIGEKWFFGRPFSVSSSVLIPRPDTELMIEEALRLASPGVLFVDIGTGSGAIAITLALESNLPTIAIDISEPALETAKQNAQTLNAPVAFLTGSLVKPLLREPTFYSLLSTFSHAIICANLPYLSEHQWHSLDSDVKNFEPKSALVGGPQGHELYEELFMQVAAHRRDLPSHITILCEIDPSQKSTLPRLAAKYFPSSTTEIKKDLRGLERLVIIEM